MPVYKYTATNMAGKTVNGQLDVADEGALAAQLQSEGLFLMSTVPPKAAGAGKRFNAKELTYFNRQLGTMLSSGITLIRAMEILLRRDITPKERAVYESLHRSLMSGEAMSDAMEGLTGVFPELLINMFRAGEANGTMDLTAMRMADHYDKESRLRSKIKSAAMYPCILLVITIGVIILIFTVVLPNFIDLYAGMELPKITQLVIALSRVFTDYYVYLIIGVLIAVALINLVYKQPAVRLRSDRNRIHMPLIGKIMRITYTARFARTLSSLYSSGLTILTALQITRNTIGNTYITAQFDELIRNVRNGSPLSESLDKIDGYDKKLSSTVMVGEESGKLETMLLAVADDFDYEAEQATQRLTALLEPMLIVIMALVIGTVMISVMLPIFQMYGTIGM